MFLALATLSIQLSRLLRIKELPASSTSDALRRMICTNVQQGIISFRESHDNKTDMDETIQHVEDVVSATFKLLTTNDMH
jgi:hypothetical protein